MNAAGGADSARHGVSTMYNGRNAARARILQPKTMRKHIQIVSWLSSSSDAYSSVSIAADLPVSDTSVGTLGTRGTWGKRKAQKERLRGLGRRLRQVRDLPERYRK